MRGLLALVCLSACVAEPSFEHGRAAITESVPDEGDPAVVALVRDGRVVCSGVLIGPHTVLTAAHCAIAAREHHAIFGPSVALGRAVTISDARPHPRFDRATWAHDLALVTLREQVEVAPVDVDVAAPTVGETFSAVGFGVTASDRADAGIRRRGVSRVTEVSDLELRAEPGPGLACNADSGGPALFGARVLGVVSHGDATCSDHTSYARIDGAFVEAYLEATREGTAEPGAPCLYEGHCRIGSCRPASDEPRLSFCSPSCRTDADCPAVMRCHDGLCALPTPSPGALGATCSAASQCLDGVCEAGRCTLRCGAALPQCPASWTCRWSSGIEYHCVEEPPAPEGACGHGASRPSGFGALALLSLVVARRIASARRITGRSR